MTDVFEIEIKFHAVILPQQREKRNFVKKKRKM